MTFDLAIKRSDPPYVAPEPESLTAWLDWHRATLLTKLDGLSEEQARYSPVPSGTSLLGLVKHLTECEHYWIARCVAEVDEPALFITEADPEADTKVTPDDTIERIVAGYLKACTRSRELIAAIADLDETRELRHGPTDVRWVLMHMVEETARHNGHADIIRELIDGVTGE
ncbi:DinB family protein [Kitasatospora acidiphila]|uniref:DinB family protein n=1 Tax=Kitasatospora acidiphila TaxID=2567942 RepID=A0A540W4V7_9ACTN|nr:DinB family protein [Kitasatospora acidiphila]TQF04069.1 DinB family protein [Kitasatospora acidiphila]